MTERAGQRYYARLVEAALLAKLVALTIVAAWLVVVVPLFFGIDALGYQAAGERLNAGHELYALSPGDRSVSIMPGLWEHPFLYPPLWGIVWRPIAALPFGLAVWMAVVIVAMMGWLVVTLRDGGKGTAAAMALLGAPFAVLLSSGNVAGLLLVGMSLVPRLSQRHAGVLVGTMAAVKVMPAVLIVWFVATRQYRAAAWAVATGAGLTVLGFLYDPALTWQYVREVVPATHPMGISPAYLLGAPWLTFAILVVGVALVLRTRSYAWAILTVLLGSPAVGVASLAQLGAISGPRHRP